MASASGPRVQDMPPPGGYSSIQFERIPARQYFKGRTIILGYLAMTAGSLYLYRINNHRIMRERVEMRSAKLAIHPLLLAERDREYLKQLRRNRDEEEKLMANVEGWKVGTWYGEPIYKTIPEDSFLDPLYEEYYIHSPPEYSDERASMALRT